MTKPKLVIKNRAEEGKRHNKREAEIAKLYFSASPSIGNLVKGAYHWASSKPGLLGEREDNLIIGTAPVVGARTGANVAKYIKSMTQPGLFGMDVFMGTDKGLKTAKAADAAVRASQMASKPARVPRYVQEVFNIKTGLPYEGALPKDWESMLPKDEWAVRTVIKYIYK